MYNPTTEDQFFQPKTNKEWKPAKNYHTMKPYIEATKNALEKKEQDTNKNEYYDKWISKGKRIALKELTEQNDIIDISH